MSGELNIHNNHLADELLSLKAPLAFIDFEAFMPQGVATVSGAKQTDTIPCQWSCHVLDEHGLDWKGKLHHSEFLWEGDKGWSPIYAFVQSLYEATKSSATILIYANYEILCLKGCKTMAARDIEKMKLNDVLDGYYVSNDATGELVPLAHEYKMLIDWEEMRDVESYPVDVYDAEHDKTIDISEIGEIVDEWYKSQPLPYDYPVVDAHGKKVPLMEIAPKIEGWCDSMLDRFYDLCWGFISLDANGKNMLGHNSGIGRWVQLPDTTSNSIKHVMPAAMEEYSGSKELLISEGEPENAYEGLRAEGNIAKGDECTTLYLNALNRDPLYAEPGNEQLYYKDGAAPFPKSIEKQCLRYCRLDTLSMVIIYLAVLEAREKWQAEASGNIMLFKFRNGINHLVENDDPDAVSMSEEELCDMDVREMLENYTLCA